MLLYYQPWMFYMHLYATLYDFWDQPINPAPSDSFCFFSCFRVSQKRKIKRSPIDLNIHRTYLFLDQKKPTEYRRWTRRVPCCPRGRGVRPPPCARPLPHGLPGDPPTYFFLLYIPIYPKNIREHNRSGVPPPEAS